MLLVVIFSLEKLLCTNDNINIPHMDIQSVQCATVNH